MANYREAEWAQFEVNFAGKRIAGLRGLNYDKSYEDEALYAAGDEPISIQSGNKAYSGELKVLKGELDLMNAAAQAAGYDDITDVHGLIIVAAYLPKGDRLLKTDTLTGVKINKLPKGWDQGAKMMDVSLPFNFLRLKQA